MEVELVVGANRDITIAAMECAAETVTLRLIVARNNRKTDRLAGLLLEVGGSAAISLSLFKKSHFPRNHLPLSGNVLIREVELPAVRLI